ncbi:hypothetical protein CRH09_00520 [Nocardia terpenica]|uniref:Resolvase/invertase-type recombinase catalytic domain-containing protein n=1 Tax=Nocardia terpenica TaxID=455432 RepID=A0A291RBZ3_9NOCA|nr:hypothetical protein CRH09_00520 [Nocardia terpenica]
MRPVAVGYIHRGVSGVRQSWDEEQIRSLARRFGYNLAKIVTFGEHTDAPTRRLCTVVARMHAAAVITPSVLHFDTAEIPAELIRVAAVVTVDTQATYARVG